MAQGRNDQDMAYQCPACLQAGLRDGQRTPIATRPQAMLEAHDLPTCDLSNHIQNRLDSAIEGNSQFAYVYSASLRSLLSICTALECTNIASGIVPSESAFMITVQ